jgi:hypothetical protein
MRKGSRSHRMSHLDAVQKRGVCSSALAAFDEIAPGSIAVAASRPSTVETCGDSPSLIVSESSVDERDTETRQEDSCDTNPNLCPCRSICDEVSMQGSQITDQNSSKGTASNERS